MTTGDQHYRDAEQRLSASDYQWQHADDDVITALGAIREAVVAQAAATLALTAAVQTQTRLAHGGPIPLACDIRDSFGKQCALDLHHEGPHAVGRSA